MMAPRLKVSSCPGCERLFASQRLFRKHTCSVSQYRRYKCGMCGHRSYRLVQLLDHERVHSYKRDFSCSRCGKTFIKSSSLQLHMKKHRKLLLRLPKPPKLKEEKPPDKDPTVVVNPPDNSQSFETREKDTGFTCVPVTGPAEKGLLKLKIFRFGAKKSGSKKESDSPKHETPPPSLQPIPPVLSVEDVQSKMPPSPEAPSIPKLYLKKSLFSNTEPVTPVSPAICKPIPDNFPSPRITIRIGKNASTGERVIVNSSIGIDSPGLTRTSSPEEDEEVSITTRSLRPRACKEKSIIEVDSDAEEEDEETLRVPVRNTRRKCSTSNGFEPKRSMEAPATPTVVASLPPTVEIPKEGITPSSIGSSPVKTEGSDHGYQTMDSEEAFTSSSKSATPSSIDEVDEKMPTLFRHDPPALSKISPANSLNLKKMGPPPEAPKLDVYDFDDEFDTPATPTLGGASKLKSFESRIKSRSPRTPKDYEFIPAIITLPKINMKATKPRKKSTPKSAGNTTPKGSGRKKSCEPDLGIQTTKAKHDTPPSVDYTPPLVESKKVEQLSIETTDSNPFDKPNMSDCSSSAFEKESLAKPPGSKNDKLSNDNASAPDEISYTPAFDSDSDCDNFDSLCDQIDPAPITTNQPSQSREKCEVPQSETATETKKKSVFDLLVQSHLSDLDKEKQMETTVQVKKEQCDIPSSYGEEHGTDIMKDGCRVPHIKVKLEKPMSEYENQAAVHYSDAGDNLEEKEMAWKPKVARKHVKRTKSRLTPVSEHEENSTEIVPSIFSHHSKKQRTLSLMGSIEPSPSSFTHDQKADQDSVLGHMDSTSLPSTSYLPQESRYADNKRDIQGSLEKFRDISKDYLSRKTNECHESLKQETGMVSTRTETASVGTPKSDIVPSPQNSDKSSSSPNCSPVQTLGHHPPVSNDASKPQLLNSSQNTVGRPEVGMPVRTLAERKMGSFQNAFTAFLNIPPEDSTGLKLAETGPSHNRRKRLSSDNRLSEDVEAYPEVWDDATPSLRRQTSRPSRKAKSFSKPLIEDSESDASSLDEDQDLVLPKKRHRSAHTPKFTGLKSNLSPHTSDHEFGEVCMTVDKCCVSDQRLKLAPGAKVHTSGCSGGKTCCCNKCYCSRRKRNFSAKLFALKQTQVVKLRHRVCRLVQVIFPDIEYPPNFNPDTDSVESFIEEIISVVKDDESDSESKRKAKCPCQGNTSYDEVYRLSVQSESIKMCQIPRKCLKNLRSKVFRLLQALLPSLAVDCVADSEQVDQLLDKVITNNIAQQKQQGMDNSDLSYNKDLSSNATFADDSGNCRLPSLADPSLKDSDIMDDFDYTSLNSPSWSHSPQTHSEHGLYSSLSVDTQGSSHQLCDQIEHRKQSYGSHLKNDLFHSTMPDLQSETYSAKGPTKHVRTRSEVKPYRNRTNSTSSNHAKPSPSQGIPSRRKSETEKLKDSLSQNYDIFAFDASDEDCEMPSLTDSGAISQITGALDMELE